MYSVSDQLNCERQSALFVSKLPQRWNAIFLNKFINHFNLETIYIADFISRNGYRVFPNYLNSRIAKDNISILFLDIEFFQGFGLDLILQITASVKVILVTFDDIVFHDVNYINSFGVDLVFAADPIAVYKYSEKLVPAELFFLENSKAVYDAYVDIKKDIDVLFFGELYKGDRKKLIDEITGRGINIKIHTPRSGELTYQELARLISRAKIILNLSKTHEIIQPNSSNPVKNFMQFKGRVIEAGLARAVCVSEYAPGIECLFGTDLVPMFTSSAQCSEIIRQLLSDEKRREYLASQFHDAVINNYEETVQVSSLLNFLLNLEKRVKSAPKWVPYQYVYGTLRARMLNFSRPLYPWIGDFTSFLFTAKCYSFRQRFLVSLHVSFDLIIKIFLRVSGGTR